MKKLFSLLLVVAMFASMSIVSFAATGANDASWEIVETAEGITATYYITNPQNVSAFTAAIKFDAAKVSADKNTPYTLGAAFAGSTVAPGSKTGHVKFAQTFGTATDRYVTATGKVECISFNFTRVDEAADLSNAFSYGTSLYVAKVVQGDGTEYTSAKAAANFAAPVYIDNRAPESPFSATAAGTTITCAGKVDATVTNYGVEFTKESTVEGARAQKYYGAMDGDTVSDGNDGVTTFTFGNWDGTFEIVLENVHAGTKVLNFFANDTIIADTTFTVVVE